MAIFSQPHTIARKYLMLVTNRSSTYDCGGPSVVEVGEVNRHRSFHLYTTHRYLPFTSITVGYYVPFLSFAVLSFVVLSFVVLSYVLMPCG